jgi:hypothetical protein
VHKTQGWAGPLGVGPYFDERPHEVCEDLTDSGLIVGNPYLNASILSELAFVGRTSMNWICTTNAGTMRCARLVEG